MVRQVEIDRDYAQDREDDDRQEPGIDPLGAAQGDSDLHPLDIDKDPDQDSLDGRDESFGELELTVDVVGGDFPGVVKAIGESFEHRQQRIEKQANERQKKQERLSAVRVGAAVGGEVPWNSGGQVVPQVYRHGEYHHHPDPRGDLGEALDNGGFYFEPGVINHLTSSDYVILL